MRNVKGEMSNDRSGWWMMRCGRRLLLPLLLFSFLLPPSSFLATTFLLTSCGGGDDDGNRMGEVILGTWKRGWAPGDVIIEGDTEWKPEDFEYDLFIFRGDGSYNGMLRNGTFTSLDIHGDVIYEGNYRCDNNNLKLEFKDESGQKQTLLCQILSFTEDTFVMKYVNEEYGITVTIKLYKDQSSSTSAS